MPPFGVRVLGALRAENRAHFHDRRDAPSYIWAKRQVMEAFCPAALDWQETVVRTSLDILRRACKVCFEAKVNEG